MTSDSQRSPEYEVWKNSELAHNFLTGVRGAVPLAGEQIDILLRLLRLRQSEVGTFLDLGCGDGILGKAIYRTYPQARGVFLDLSETMLQAARESFTETKQQPIFILEDFGRPEWVEAVKTEAPFDAIVSGFAIHHQPDGRKREIYQEIYQLLKPGGIFLNLEHVASRSKLGETAFDNLFLDSLDAFHQSQGSQKSREELNRQYYNREDKKANILALVEEQCNWLREIGFVDVDCFLKIFELALFGGVKVF
jgi:SAM-dependent methyltransferase